MDDERMTAIQKYLAENPSVKDTPGGVHIHFHNGPVVENPNPVDQNPGQNVLEKYTPHLVLGAICAVPVGGLVTLVVVMIPAILALTAMVVGFLLALAVCVIAAAMLVKNVKETPSKGKRK